MEQDFFKSTPAIGATERDWTEQILTVDVVNSINENFHFEILPNEKDSLPTRATDSPADKHGKTFVNVIIPIL